MKVERFLIIKPASPNIHRVLMIKLDKEVDKSKYRNRFFEVSIKDNTDLKQQTLHSLKILFEMNDEFTQLVNQIQPDSIVE